METGREVVNLTFDVFILFFIYIKHLKLILPFRQRTFVHLLKNYQVTRKKKMNYYIYGYSSEKKLSMAPQSR